MSWLIGCGSNTRRPKPRRVIQTYVTRLRKTLGPADRTVVARPAGFLLQAPEAAIDAARFRAHAERARLARGLGELRTDADELRTGLALWRGEPLSDVPSDSLRRETRKHPPRENWSGWAPVFGAGINLVGVGPRFSGRTIPGMEPITAQVTLM